MLLPALALSGLLTLPGLAKAVKGEVPPDFTGTTLDGKKITLSAFRGKNPVVVSFYADFCEPCKEEFPKLKELDERHGSRGLKIIGVALDRDAQKAAKLPGDTKVRFPIVHDADGAIAGKYGVQAIPHTVVVDRSGKVQSVFIGYDPDDLQKAVEAAVK